MLSQEKAANSNEASQMSDQCLSMANLTTKTIAIPPHIVHNVHGTYQKKAEVVEVVEDSIFDGRSSFLLWFSTI